MVLLKRRESFKYLCGIMSLRKESPCKRVIFALKLLSTTETKCMTTLVHATVKPSDAQVVEIC